MKENKNCLNCNKEFSTYTNGKFCCNSCYYSFPKKERTQAHKDLNRERLKNYYKSSKWQLEKLSRGNKIKESLTKKLSLEEKEKLKIILNEGYVNNKRILAYHISPGYSYRRIDTVLEEDVELKNLYNKSFKFAPERIQKMTLEEWFYFKKCFKKQNITEFCENFKINSKTHKRLSLHFGELISKKYNRQKESNPERVFRELLLKENVNFIQEKLFNNNYYIDFVIGNIAIEIQGDYWHGNPKFYSEINLNTIQKKHILRDGIKQKEILSSSFMFIEIWENDIKNNIKKIKQLIKIIKNGKYNRKFYTTSSWK